MLSLYMCGLVSTGKQCKLILKLILHTLSDILQGMYGGLFFMELIFAENFHVLQKLCFENFKILKWDHLMQIA